MFKTGIIVFILLNSILFEAQIYTGTVSAKGSVIEGAAIDVYDYSQIVQTYHSDKNGRFAIPLFYSKEYLIVISSEACVSVVQSVNLGKDFNDYIILNIDNNVPNGKLSSSISSRIQYSDLLKNENKVAFDYTKLNSLKKADSIKVMYNKVQVSQYRYFSDYSYAKEKEELKKLNPAQIEKERIQTQNKLDEIKRKIDLSNTKMFALMNEENSHVEAAKTSKGNDQLKQLVDAQETLCQRIYETGNNYLLHKNENLTIYKLKILDYYNIEDQARKSSDYSSQINYKKDQLNAQSSAYNYLYVANNNFDKYEYHLQLYQNAYQEYIELLTYYKKQQDTARLADNSLQAASVLNLKKVSNLEIPINLPKIEREDTLLTMNDNDRKQTIINALAEEERFKSFEQKEGTKMLDGEQVNVLTIKLSSDIYEKITTKKGLIKYYKNTKPVAAATFKFETTRRYVNTLNGIR